MEREVNVIPFAHRIWIALQDRYEASKKNEPGTISWIGSAPDFDEIGNEVFYQSVIEHKSDSEILKWYGIEV